MEEDATREYIKWMEENNASVEETAEHFGITRVTLIRSLMIAGYEGEIKPDEGTEVPMSFRVQRTHWA